MTGEEIFGLLQKMAARGDSPRKRERHLKRLADQLGLSSDALRAKARRWGKKSGATYPLMRKPASENREGERTTRRATRLAWRQERLDLGKAALAKGADWTAIAQVFGIETPEGAAQWWRRNHDGVTSTRKAKGRKRRKKVAA